ncbi:glycosyltransferase family 4 protein [Lutibacter sp.]|uniref:glycosyltransferase family 4 protein n=1 Tax=Lutibacter sp. TaxID=1925666 RepID=UPI001A21D13B|nr:glycosyltransferase family 4 protein [Lutibacter sp.]MBI9041550.1 glycosyltransferase family 4 protein [Lutibacter sp.]
MKIMYVTDQLYLHGGIEKITTEKMNYLTDNFGYEVILCTSEHKENAFVYKLSKKVRHLDLGINYFRKLSYFHPKNLLKSISHYRALRKLIQQEKPAIIISVNYTPEQFFLPFIAKEIAKVKEFHSSGYVLKTPVNLMDKLKYQMFLLLDKYHIKVVLNDCEKQYYPFKNIEVIPNFISYNNKLKSTVVKEKTIIAAGRIAPVKQFDHLIKAWSLIATNFPDWRVKIFGDGDAELSLKLEGLIKELKVPNIYLMGATNCLEEEFQKSSCYAMTSATECFPMVLLEAMSQGLPIVSYDCPHGPSTIITDSEDGILVDHNDIDIFANKLAFLISNKDLRDLMSKEAIKKASKFEAKVIMQQWKKLFLNIK